MSKLKFNLKRQQLETLKTFIDDLLTKQEVGDSDDDKLLFANLAEVSESIYTKLGKYQKEYKLGLSPAQAIALRLLFVDYVKEATSYLGNLLHNISSTVHQKFN